MRVFDKSCIVMFDIGDGKEDGSKFTFTPLEFREDTPHQIVIKKTTLDVRSTSNVTYIPSKKPPPKTLIKANDNYEDVVILEETIIALHKTLNSLEEDNKTLLEKMIIENKKYADDKKKWENEKKMLEGEIRKLKNMSNSKTGCVPISFIPSQSDLEALDELFGYKTADHN